MAIIGFDLNKINIERIGNVSGEIKINNNVSIKEIDKITVPIKKEDQEGLRFGFEFTSNYEPKIGNLVIKGNVIVVEDKKKAEDILKQWKKDKKAESNVMTDVLNTVLEKCNIEALILGRDVNLPPSIPLPKVKPKKA
ncbi:MAG TPA: hypothetical protein ENL45_01665 [Candidatus Woesearchaeota archaeon]|nr:hypothetical protein [Candidatus Woesearchaeota archaeon]